MTEGSKPAVAPYAVASGVTCAIGLAFAVLLPEATRAAGVYGIVAASAGALCGLAALAANSARSAQGVLLGFTIGFLCRGALVAIGLVASRAQGNAALVYVACFFGLYVATQIVEILFVAKSARASAPGDAQ